MGLAATTIAGTAFALLAGAGCSSIALRSSEARTPILLGPVACLGCAPEPRAAAPATVAGGVREREYTFPMLGSYADKIVRGGTPLDVAATETIRDPCREDLHVASIQTGTWGFDVPLLFAMGDAWIDVQASRATIPNGSCSGTTPASARPAAIHGTPAESPRGGRRP